MQLAKVIVKIGIMGLVYKLKYANDETDAKKKIVELNSMQKIVDRITSTVFFVTNPRRSNR